MRHLSLVPFLLMAACASEWTPTGDDDASPGDDDASDDDSSPADDDVSDDDVSDDDVSDDDVSDDDVSDDDVSDDDVSDDDTAPPADCSAIAAAGFDLCHDGGDICEAVFDGGEGCTVVCAEAGLACTGTFENREDACAPDLSRPPLECDSGHQSDFCVCGGTGEPATPDPGEVFSDPSEQLLAERVGFGAGATGGRWDHLYVVTTLADSGAGSLRDALESSEPHYVVFDVDGTIVLEDDLEVRSEKTVDGRGRDVTVDGTWKLEDVHDVIVSDLRLTRSIREGEEACEQTGDVVTIRGDGGPSPSDFTSHDLWFHHVEFFDGGDGLLDIRGGTDITVSWSHFHTHKKVTLAWQDDGGDPAHGMRVTWHHDMFDRTTVRNPRFHYGQAHFFNNYLLEWWQYGANAVDEALFLSEGNVYEAAANCVGIPGVFPCEDTNPCGDDDDWFVDRKIAVAYDEDGNPEGYVRSEGDLALNDARVEENQREWVPDVTEYAYSVEPATAALADAIVAGVGPRTGWTWP